MFMSSYIIGNGNHSSILNNFFLIFIQRRKEVMIFLKPSVTQRMQFVV